jgi:hypothetical protein
MAYSENSNHTHALVPAVSYFMNKFRKLGFISTVERWKFTIRY